MVILVTALVPALVAPSAGAATKTDGVLKLSASAGTAGDGIRVTGRIAPRVKHQVQLQRSDGGAFVTVATTTTARTGRFAFVTTLPSGVPSATYRVFSPRIKDPRTRKKVAYATPVRSVTVQQPVTPPVGPPVIPPAPTTPPVIANAETLPAATVGVRYDHLLRTADGRAGSWAVVDGSPPGGLALVGDRIQGTPTTTGNVMFTIRFTDGSGGTASRAFLLSTNPAPVPPAGSISRVSWASDGSVGDNDSYESSISADGRVVAFSSMATNLVPGDTNGSIDLFVRDRQTAVTSRVSVAAGGAQADDASGTPGISGDGRYVVFESSATNLVAGDTNGKGDVFVHDRQSGTTTRVSVASEGTQGDADSRFPVISPDGRYVGYGSASTNLVPGDANGVMDAFVHDRQTGTTTRVAAADDGSPTDNGSLPGAISSGGRWVAVYSSDDSLVPGDTNGHGDAFVHDRQTGTTTRVSVASDGTQGDRWAGVPRLSDDGRYVVFESSASNLVAGDSNDASDVFVHDRQTGTTTMVTRTAEGGPANGGSYNPGISADGRHVVFDSAAWNLVPGDSYWYGDTFVHDRQTGTTTRISVAPDGTDGQGGSGAPTVSADGRYVSFVSGADNLVATDPDDTDSDVFVWDRGP